MLLLARGPRRGCAALGRYIDRTKPTTDTVELEASARRLSPGSRYDIVDIDRLSWPIRNREGLLAALRRGSSDRAQAERRPLDRTIGIRQRSRASCCSIARRVEAKPGLTGAEIPLVEAECSSVKTSCTSKQSMTAGSIASSIVSRALRARTSPCPSADQGHRLRAPA